MPGSDGAVPLAMAQVLLEEVRIRSNEALGIGYGGHASRRDIILPEATGLERWDAHSQNSYQLIPYTGIRQP